MPYINVRLTDDNVTAKQKQDLIRGITNVMIDVLDKSPATTFVVIDEVKLENWGVGGESVAQRRASKERGHES